MIGIGARIIYLGARKMYYGPGMYKGGPGNPIRGPGKKSRAREHGKTGMCDRKHFKGTLNMVWKCYCGA